MKKICSGIIVEVSKSNLKMSNTSVACVKRQNLPASLPKGVLSVICDALTGLSHPCLIVRGVRTTVELILFTRI